MPDREIYAQAVPEDAQVSSRDTASAEVSTDYALSGGGAPTEQLGPNPNALRVQATLRGAGAEDMAKEIGELFSSGDIQFVPYFGVGVSTAEDGYYATEEDRESPVDPRQRADLYEVDARLDRIGSRQTHLRRASARPTAVDNDFGSDEEARLAVDDRATGVAWYDRETGELDGSASPTGDREGDWGHVDYYDTDDSPFDRPELVFDLEYRFQPRADVGVWDSKGNDEKTNADGNVVWRKVYDHKYDPDDAFVLESGILRLTLGPGTAEAERWDADDDAYEPVALGESDWEPERVDVRRIGTARLRALVTFVDDSGSSYDLRMTLERGDEDALFYRTENASSATPQGLVDLLEPVASTRLYRTGANDSLVNVETEVTR